MLKFERLAAPAINDAQRAAIVETVAQLENKHITQLTELLRAATAQTR